MSECLFCKMVAGELVPDVVFENDHVMAFRDINAQAPTHILIIPKLHIATMNELAQKDAALVGEMFLAGKEVARLEGLSERGYRAVMNCNQDAGQTVFHIHLHILGGRALGWPPG